MTWVLVVVIALLVWWCVGSKEGLSHTNPDCGKYNSAGFVPGCHTPNVHGYPLCPKGYAFVGPFYNREVPQPQRFCHINPFRPHTTCKCCPVKNLPPCN